MGIVMDQLQPLECVHFSFLCLPRLPGEPLSLRIAAAVAAAVVVVATAAATAVNLLWAILSASNRQPEEDRVRSQENESERERG